MNRTPRNLSLQTALALVLALSLDAAQAAGPPDLSIHVDCGKAADRLLKATGKLLPDTTVHVSGACQGPVEIRQDGIRLISTTGASISGSDGALGEFDAVLRISGARNVYVEGLTVSGGPGNGVVIEGGAAVRLHDVNATGNQVAGLFVDGASVELSNFAASGNRIGIDAINGSRVLMQQSINTGGNLANGFELNFGATAEMRGANWTSNNNGAFGVVIGTSVLSMAGFDQTLETGNTLVTNDNGAGGMVLASASLEIVGSAGAGSSPPHLVQAKRNPVGILGPQRATISVPFGTARLELEDNFGVGLVLANDSSLQMNGGLNISGSPVGLDSSASTLVISANTDNPSNLAGNFVSDIRLTFGTTADLDIEQLNSWFCSNSLSTLCP